MENLDKNRVVSAVAPAAIADLTCIRGRRLLLSRVVNAAAPAAIANLTCIRGRCLLLGNLSTPNHRIGRSMRTTLPPGHAGAPRPCEPQQLYRPKHTFSGSCAEGTAEIMLSLQCQKCGRGSSAGSLSAMAHQKLLITLT